MNKKNHLDEKSTFRIKVFGKTALPTIAIDLARAFGPEGQYSKIAHMIKDSFHKAGMDISNSVLNFPRYQLADLFGAPTWFILIDFLVKGGVDKTKLFNPKTKLFLEKNSQLLAGFITGIGLTLNEVMQGMRPNRSFDNLDMATYATGISMYLLSDKAHSTFIKWKKIDGNITFSDSIKNEVKKNLELSLKSAKTLVRNSKEYREILEQNYNILNGKNLKNELEAFEQLNKESRTWLKTALENDNNLKGKTWAGILEMRKKYENPEEKIYL